MNEIDFSEKQSKEHFLNTDRNKWIIAAITAFVISVSVYFILWKTNFNNLESAIEKENLQVSQDLLGSLKLFPIKLSSLDPLERKVRKIEYTEDTLNAFSSNSIYNDDFYGITYSKQEYDTIIKTLNLLREKQFAYNDILQPIDQLKLEIQKLKGLWKLLLRNNHFGFDSDKYFRIATYSVFSNYDFAKGYDVEIDLKDLEEESALVLDKIDLLINDLEVLQIDFKEHLPDYYYHNFILDPSVENLDTYLYSSVYTELDSGNSEEDFTKRLLKSIYRLQGVSSIQVPLEINRDQQAIDKVYDILEDYTICVNDECFLEEKLWVLYFTSSGIKNDLTKGGKVFKGDPFRIGARFLPFLWSSKPLNNIGSIILSQYASFLYRIDNISGLIRFRNELNDILEHKGVTLGNYNSLTEEIRLNIASVYYVDANMRWTRNDFRAIEEDYSRMNELLGLLTLSRDGYNNSISSYTSPLKPSYIFRNWWAVKYNLKHQDACNYLKKAYELNPDEFYEEYLKNCLSK